VSKGMERFLLVAVVILLLSGCSSDAIMAGRL
jgi:uncharacterized protein YceK